MTGMSQTGCCCGTDNPCKDCTKHTRICCMKLTNTKWVRDFILVNDRYREFYSGDTCPEYIPIDSSNICGSVSTTWREQCCWPPSVEPRCAAPRVDRAGYCCCLPTVVVTWYTNSECNQVTMRLKVTGSHHLFFDDGGILTTGITKYRDVTLSTHWYESPVTILDPFYEYMNATYPDDYPGPIPSFTLEVCPEEYFEFPMPEDEEIFLKGEYQRLVEGEWVTDLHSPWSPYPLTDLVALGRGSCVCGGPCTPRDGTAAFLYWKYDPYFDEVVVTDLNRGIAEYGHYVVLPYRYCDWMTDEFYIEYPEGPSYLWPFWRMKITRIDSCGTHGGGGDPEPPPKYCRNKNLCVMLAVDEGANYQYWNMWWDKDTEQYYLSPQAVPGSKPYTIEITLKEHPELLPPTGYRAWVLTVVIREVPSGTVILEYTETYILDCTHDWLNESSLGIPIEPPETWQLHIGTHCPDPPEPPSCDPGCWPECVMCPERKALYLVVDEDPVCCLAGTYALTWSGTGTTGYYYLATPTGTSTASCGLISAFTVTCVDSTHIHVSITYRVIYGLESNAVTESYNLSVACVSGHMESETMSYTLFGDQDALCGSGSDYGGTIRVVSA